MSRDFVDGITAWYRKNKRDLPWRETADPYCIWVSEVLLQQTQVSRGIKYYLQFLDRFPTVQHLAKASWRNVLPVWRGLGYYRRGENMLRTAKIIVQKYDGHFPSDPKELQTLPGIGPYTAAAIASFAFKRPVPALDTNITRVLGRYFGSPENQVRFRAESIFLEWPRRSATLNHALMDLGSLVCTSRKADCERCPARSGCHFFQSGERDRLLNEQRRSSRERSVGRRRMESVIDVGLACIHDQGTYLLGERIAAKGGEWEFPGGKREGSESIRACIKREAKEELGIEVSVRPHFHLEEIREKNTTWRLHFCRCRILRGKAECREHQRLKWVPPAEFNQHKMPKANQKALVKLASMRASGAR